MRRAALVAALIAAGVLLTAPGSDSAPVTVTAPSSTLQEARHPVVLPTLTKKERKKRPATRSLSCRNRLAQVLYGAGFRGENLHEAWAIAMRESNGKNLGPGDSQFNGEDWGIVQFNKPTWGDESWWSDSKILDPAYSAKIMFRMSRGGKTWQMWGLTGSGELDTSMYGGWSADQQWAWIIEPYQRWYRQYPC